MPRRTQVVAEVAALDGSQAMPIMQAEVLRAWPDPELSDRVEQISAASGRTDSSASDSVEYYHRTPAAIAGHISFILIYAAVTSIAIRQATRPLAEITAAADEFRPGGVSADIAETGPLEIVALARAFNTMRARILQHLEERVQILSAFSHDMQTPITRMRLRAELATDFPERERMLNDLVETERLIREGIAYARNAHIQREELMTVDLQSFIDSIAHDYRDTGRSVTTATTTSGTLSIRQRALRRVLCNLIDNALKFSGAAEIAVTRQVTGRTVISVMDRGPGIAVHLLESVKKPFVRIERPGGDKVAGSGLGLTIAHQLAETTGGVLDLRNREGGGLIAEIILS